MIDPRFALLGMAAGAIGCLVLVARMSGGHAEPRLVTWLLWSLAPLVAFVGQLMDGAGLAAVLTLGVGAGPAFILVVALVQGRGTWVTDWLDRACLALGLLGLGLLSVARAAALAVVLAVAVDLLATLPTLRQAWSAPWLESPWPYGTAACNAALALLTLPGHSLAKSAFPAYVLLICCALFLLLITRGGAIQRRTGRSNVTTAVSAGST